MKYQMLFVTLFLSACASNEVGDGTDRGLDGVPVQYSNARTVEEIRNLEPQAKLPLDIVVMRSQDWDSKLSVEERKIINSWEKELQEVGFAKSIQIVPESLVPSCGYRSDPNCFIEGARAAGARLHADAILFIDDNTVTDAYLNPFSILNLTIIGMWLAPGHNKDSYSIYEASLFDVNNGYLYAIADGEGEKKLMRPYMFTEWDMGQAEAKAMALDNLGQRLLAIARQKTSANKP